MADQEQREINLDDMAYYVVLGVDTAGKDVVAASPNINLHQLAALNSQLQMDITMRTIMGAMHRYREDVRAAATAKPLVITPPASGRVD